MRRARQRPVRRPIPNIVALSRITPAGAVSIVSTAGSNRLHAVSLRGLHPRGQRHDRPERIHRARSLARAARKLRGLLGGQPRSIARSPRKNALRLMADAARADRPAGRRPFPLERCEARYAELTSFMETLRRNGSAEADAIHAGAPAASSNRQPPRLAAPARRSASAAWCAARSMPPCRTPRRAGSLRRRRRPVHGVASARPEWRSQTPSDVVRHRPQSPRATCRPRTQYSAEAASDDAFLSDSSRARAAAHPRAVGVRCAPPRMSGDRATLEASSASRAGSGFRVCRRFPRPDLKFTRVAGMPMTATIVRSSSRSRR